VRIWDREARKFARADVNTGVIDAQQDPERRANRG
jgi:hypothetical protein